MAQTKIWTALAVGLVTSVLTAATAFGAFSGFDNGSFESGSYANGGSGFQTLSAGNSNITDWVITSGGIDWIGSYWVASDGSRSIDLNSTGPGTIANTFQTTPGNTYVVRFDLSANPAGGALLATVSVDADATGAAPQQYSFDTAARANTLGNMKWDERQYVLTATGVSTTITFSSLVAGAYGPALDNVRVTEQTASGDLPSSKAECLRGGWRTLEDHLGNGFKNQGDCVSYVATGGRNLGAMKR